MAWCGKWCWWLTMVFVGVLSFFGGTYLADRDLPFVRTSGFAVPANPKPGDRIQIYWDAEVKRVCPGEITRWWTDSDGDRFELPTSPARYGERSGPGVKMLTSVMIPRSATCGRNVYTSDAKYWCNWTHKLFPLQSAHSIDVDVSCDPLPEPPSNRLTPDQ